MFSCSLRPCSHVTFWLTPLSRALLGETPIPYSFRQFFFIIIYRTFSFSTPKKINIFFVGKIFKFSNLKSFKQSFWSVNLVYWFGLSIWSVNLVCRFGLSIWSVNLLCWFGLAICQFSLLIWSVNLVCWFGLSIWSVNLVCWFGLAICQFGLSIWSVNLVWICN